jgi:hypothetical protein
LSLSLSIIYLSLLYYYTKFINSRYPPCDERDPEFGHAQNNESVDEGKAGDNGDDDQPEPDEDVDLLVDDVEREHAEAILLLDSAGGTVVVEGTLGHLGEDLGHGVRPFFGFHFGVGQNVKAVVPELVAKEEVGEVDLAQDVGKVKGLAQEEPEGVKPVGASVKTPVANNIVNLATIFLNFFLCH